MKDIKKEKKRLIIWCVVVGLIISLKALLYGEGVRIILAAWGGVAICFSIYQILKWYDKEEK